MSEMFDLNLIEGVYNKFGNEIERIYNNRNEIIWELDDSSNDYLWVEPDESMIGTGSNYIGFVKVNPPYNETNMPQNSIQYSFDCKTWEYMPYDEHSTHDEIEITQKTYFRYVYDGFIRHRIIARHATSSSGWDKFKCNVGGSLHKYMNNVYYNEILFGVPIDDMTHMFFIGLGIIDASKLHIDYYKDNNVIPYGYHNMFYNQLFMTKPPILHDTILAERCYQSMFYGCSSLVTAPELPATTLAERCYQSMFYGCSSLVTAPELPATTLAERCYQSMFYGCSSLVTAPELPATTLAANCYDDMFKNCTSLVNAPELPATTLADGCYSGMFWECTSLVNAPALHATNLQKSCYGYMFYGCTSLVNAPALPATILTEYCYSNMFCGCTSLKYSPILIARQLVNYCYNRMFYNCDVLSYIYCYAENPTVGLDEWVYNVSNKGEFRKLKDVEWPTGVNGIPENWFIFTEQNP